jgi:DNA repair exonuclease SbcCD nuclease subunit
MDNNDCLTALRKNVPKRKGMVTIMGEKTQATVLKFLHIGDIHLDTPFVGLAPEKSDERKVGLRESFLKMMDYVRGAGVNYVLISGDLFETECATGNTADLLIREFRNAPDTKFIIAPGKHDSYENNPIYTSGRLPSNCYIFNSDKLDRFDFEEDRVVIYGWAFVNGGIVESPLYDRTVGDSSKINIVCGYADLDGEVGSDCCPVSTTDLKKFGADYYAFGSRHEGGDFVNLGSAMYGYSGAIESTGFDEPGIGGAKLVTVKYMNGEMSMDAKNLTFGKIAFKKETIDVTGVNSGSEIVSRVSSLVSEKKYDENIALYLELTGEIDPRFIIPKNLGSDAFGLYSFEIKDRTLPLYNTKSFRRDMSVKGELFRQLLPMLESKDEEERLLGARAFREGLAALENREIDT